MTVFLTTTDPTGDAEELYADRAFLIRGPVENGKVIYYLTRALERYAVPDVPASDGRQTVEEYFDLRLLENAYSAVEVMDNKTRFFETAQSKMP